MRDSQQEDKQPHPEPAAADKDTSFDAWGTKDFKPFEETKQKDGDAVPFSTPIGSFRPTNTDYAPMSGVEYTGESNSFPQ